MKSYLFKTPAFECDYTDINPERGVIFGNHCHLTCEFMIILEGFVSVATESRIYRNLSKGTLVMIPPLSYHSSFSAVPCRYRRITVRFSENEIPSEIRASLLAIMKSAPVLPLTGAGFLTENLYRAISLQDSQKYAPLIAGIMTQLFYYSLESDHPLMGAEKDERLESAMIYIDEHMNQKITLTELAEHSFISVSTLCHLFQSQMKISVKQYILQKKIHYAAGLIQSGLPSVKAAEMIGYKNYADFYTVYKKTTGHAPSCEKNRSDPNGNA